MNETANRRIPRWWLRAALAVLGLAVLLLALEGLFSLGRMVSVVSRQAQPVPADHRHTGRDPRLGWISDAGVEERDAYGPWRALSTDDRGLRIDGDSAADGGRLACVGGSNVFGVGVGDDETWCRRLGLADADHRTVNLGQPGYDPLQSLLLYERLDDVEHDVVLFVLDRGSMERLLAQHDAGFPKPGLSQSSSGLSLTGTPVPRGPYVWPWATVNRHLLAESRLLDGILPEARREAREYSALGGAMYTDRLLTALRGLTEQRDVKPVVLFLPGMTAKPRESAKWYDYLAGELEASDIGFIDLEGPFRDLPPSGRRELFYPGGYFTPFGHYWVASHLEAALAESGAVDEFDGDGDRPWLARYFRGPLFAEQVGSERLSLLAVNWGPGAALAGLPPDAFSAVFDSCLSLEESRDMRLLLEADGHAELAVNGQTVLDTGDEEGTHSRVNTVSLPAGENHLRVRYTEKDGGASVRLVTELDGDRVRVPGAETLSAPDMNDGEPACGN